MGVFWGTVREFWGPGRDVRLGKIGIGLQRDGKDLIWGEIYVARSS